MLNKNLFNEITFENIETEGVKYAGSKDKIIPYKHSTTMRRICIKCGVAFKGTKKENICPDCKFQILKE